MNSQGSKNIPNSEYEERKDQQRKSQGHKSKKTKTIAKNAGRPSKKNPNNIINDEQFNKQGGKQPLTEKIIVAIIDFFNQTGNKKGFVFTKDIRSKLKKCMQNIADEEKWEKIVQITKISKLCASNSLCQSDKAKIERLMIETSGIFSQQFTDEYYLIFLRTYLLLKREREEFAQDMDRKEDMFNSLADDIFKNKDKEYSFFSYSFVSLCNIGLKKPENSAPYRKFIHSLRECILQQQ